jgi:hypothetical protein
VQDHEDELDGHVMASSFDTGTGRIRGFVTSARLTEMQDVLDAALAPVAGLGPFTHTDAAFVWGYANAEIAWGRLDRAGVQKIIDGGLGEQMRAFRVMRAWENGSRGRQK